MVGNMQQLCLITMGLTSILDHQIKEISLVKLSSKDKDRMLKVMGPMSSNTSNTACLNMRARKQQSIKVSLWVVVVIALQILTIQLRAVILTPKEMNGEEWPGMAQVVLRIK